MSSLTQSAHFLVGRLNFICVHAEDAIYGIKVMVIVTRNMFFLDASRLLFCLPISCFFFRWPVSSLFIIFVCLSVLFRKQHHRTKKAKMKY